MRTSILSTLATLMALSLPAAAQDVAAGEKVMRKCKACHRITDGDTVIFKGGKTGPDLFGVVGRGAGLVAGFRYSKSMQAAREAGLIWEPDQLTAYLQDPSGFLKSFLDDPKAKSKMTLKLKTGMADVIAYLDSVAQ